MKTTENKEWTLPGMCFNVKKPAEPNPGSLVFPSGRNVTFPGSTTHSGQAVDANVAAMFINNFHNYYQIIFDGPEKPVGGSDKDQTEHTLDFEALKSQHDALKTHHSDVKQLNKRLVELLTYGMTLDKDLLLSVLGQQNCEGIRFYLCARPIDGKYCLSLVAVGVDKDAVDLNYGKVKTEELRILMNEAKNIPTQSVTLEYTTPPPPNTKDSHHYGGPPTADQILPQYALLKLARANQLQEDSKDNPFVLL